MPKSAWPCVSGLCLQGTTAEVYLHGAHVTSFKPFDSQVRGAMLWGREVRQHMRQNLGCAEVFSHVQEVIFVSKEAIFKPPKAIR